MFQNLRESAKRLKMRLGACLWDRLDRLTRGAAAPKPEKAELVTLRQLADSIGEAHGLSHKAANELLSGAIASITAHLKKGARIRIAGLGTFEVRKRAARTGRNPATGEAIKIKASKKVAFRAAKDLSESI